MKTWDEFITQQQEEPYYKDLMHFLEDAYKHKTIYPPKEDLFTCFSACPLQDVKVVILGQDPYHQPNQAHGLCFSVRKDIKLPQIGRAHV